MWSAFDVFKKTLNKLVFVQSVSIVRVLCAQSTIQIDLKTVFKSPISAI